MDYLPYALAAPILMAIANIIQKLVVSDDKIHGGIFAGAFGLLVAALTLPFALATEQLNNQMFNGNTISVLLLMTSLYTVAMWGFFTSMKHIPVSEIIFLESATPIWVFLGSIIFLGESFSIYKLIGVILVIVGILVAFRYKGTKSWTKYHSLGLLSGAFYAGAYMTDKYLLQYIPTLSYQVMSFGLPAIALLIICNKKLSDLQYFIVNKKARRIIWSAIFAGLSFYELFRAYQISDQISLINPIFETKALWVMILGIALLNEREHMFRKIVGISIALGGIFLINGISMKKNFSNEIANCNNSPSNIRFSCYRNTIETYYKKNIQGLLSAIKNEKGLVFEDLQKDTPNISYAVFGTNCHSFYHSVGDFIATTSDIDLDTKIKMCSASCTSGCIMGLFKRTALEANFENSTLEKFYPSCPDDMKHQCAHEVGHVLHDKYTTSILGVIDPITENTFKLAPKKTYSYVTNKNPDLNAPFEDCKKLVPESELAYCYTGVGHNLFLFSEFSKDGYKQSIAECSGTEESHKGDCYSFLVYRIGINNASTKFLSKKYEEGISVCSDITKTIGRPDLEKHCYLGVGGGIGLFIDSEFAGREINEKNFPMMREKIYEQIYSCDNAPEKFQKDCYTGLLGTPVKKLYKTFNLEIEMIDTILPTIDNGFQVVG